MAAFLDVTSAYDNVLYKVLILKLIEIKCRNRIINMINTWMYERKVRFIKEKGKKVIRTVYKGLPQGAVLSPMLYNIYKNDICKDIPKEIKQVQFADDIAVFCTETRLNTRKYLIESAIKNIHESLMEKGLEIRPKKTKIVDFNKEGIYNKRTIINCIGTDIKLCQEAKF